MRRRVWDGHLPGRWPGRAPAKRHYGGDSPAPARAAPQAQACAMRINHVSVNATDLAASVRFYTELFDAVELPTPNFGLPVRWLGLGDAQLHLFEADCQLRSRHHFALTVVELEPVYRRAAA